MAIPVNTSSGVVYVVGWGGTISGTSVALTGQLAVSNGANAETNVVRWTSNVAEVGMVAGTGTNRNLRLLGGTQTIIFQVGGSDRAIIGTNGTFTKANNTVLAGMGTPLVVAAGRVTAQSAANASIATFTVGASDGSFEVSANMNVTASATLVTTLTCTYTDEANVARTLVLPVAPLSGTWATAGAITGAGASVWHTAAVHIRAKASTAITILTSTGTFTTVTYSAEGVIKQTA